MPPGRLVLRWPARQAHPHPRKPGRQPDLPFVSGTPCWRPDLADDPRFATAALRAQNIDALHAIVQTWMLTFRDMAALDAQRDESKIAIGEIRTTQEAAQTEWAEYWGAVLEVPDRFGGTLSPAAAPWRFSEDTLDAPSAPAFRGRA
ncbi:hypothetical protein BZM27_54410 [Paraburkholderia steynii]|uniref:Uncharacterized protein n=1 Tax=Paraburkholderia steynii TaxID=1245441 RepID=A0A4R0WZE9_9BURK|nr:hypothetical protein BZM27_54410 [Paraburkholderia steynii]